MDETTQLQQWFDGQGITLTILAKKTGLSLSYLSRIMSGERAVSDTVKLRIGKAYGYDEMDRIFANNGNGRSQ
ncbi:MAG: helix-turn-helix transcriptional regulator [Caldilinea sp.]|nr:helix-turn-helix transcriptional regulator [Caldilinea sp.]